MHTYKKNQGVALVAVLLSAMVLLIALLAISATLTISSRRTTVDQRITLQAQYAAESGLSRAYAELVGIQDVVEKMKIPSNQNANNVETHVKNFCDKNSLINVPSNYNNWTEEQKQNGIQLCEAAPADQGGNNRYSLFTAYVPSDAYPNGSPPPGQFWRNVFSGASGTPIATKIYTDVSNGAETWYQTRFGLTPIEVRAMAPDFYRFVFRYAPTRSVGEVRASGQVVATRTVQEDVSGDFFIDVLRPSFARYMFFRNNTRSLSGGQLYFAGGEVFNGPVHTNGRPGFYRYGGQVPLFNEKFTSAWSSFANSRRVGISSTEINQVFPNVSPEFGVDSIPLPANSNNQLRASFGGDATDTSNVPESEIRNAWGVNNSGFSNSVYYSSGSGSNRNTGNQWLGGIYVRGDADQLKFSTVSNRQVIEITQGATSTRFEENPNGSWTVKENGATVKTLSGTFNGMIYVGGQIASLVGDGTNNPDIAANSQLTVTATGDIKIQQDITYTDNPVTNENALNVLGIFSSSGSVLADGPNNRDLNINATIMASASSKGFGTVNPSSSRGSVNGRKAQINLIGGIIEDQSQTVGYISGGGYNRNYDYDQRFKTGFAPPFFPTQANWAASASEFSSQKGVWQTVKGGF